MNKIELVYVTTPNKSMAKDIAMICIRKKLAACANILSSMESVYRWKGEICCEEEFVLLLKTKKNLVPKLTETIQEAHSSELPCVVSLPVTGGSSAFLDWISNETTTLDQEFC